MRIFNGRKKYSIYGNNTTIISVVFLSIKTPETLRVIAVGKQMVLRLLEWK